MVKTARRNVIASMVESALISMEFVTAFLDGKEIIAKTRALMELGELSACMSARVLMEENAVRQTVNAFAQQVKYFKNSFIS